MLFGFAFTAGNYFETYCAICRIYLITDHFGGKNLAKYFGTDGFRGKANVKLTAKEAYRIGRFLGWYFGKTKKARILVGKDPRRSSYTLEYSLVSGITASGGDAYLMHVTTTPSVSYVVSREEFDAAVMISASHNAFCDNGIKIMNSFGEKADDEFIAKIESYLDEEFEIPLSVGDKIGKVEDYFVGRNRYMSFLMSVPSNSFKGYKVALDTANGSTYMIAKTVFSSLGAKVYAINDCPDGININASCGATDVKKLVKQVKDFSCDFGFAFDGDGDRCIAVDENGKVTDGDMILYALAVEMKNKGNLVSDTVVSTVDSNVGLKDSLREKGIQLIETNVGDRFVAAKMKEGYVLGGESSGHIIIKKFMSSGDGILTALMLTETAISKKCPFSTLFSEMTLYPEVKQNVPAADKSVVERVDFIAALESIKARFEAKKLLVRASGTEDVIRITASCESEEKSKECVKAVCEEIREKSLQKRT